MRLPQPEKSNLQPGLLAVLIVLSLLITTIWYREGTSGPIHRVRDGVQTVTAPVGATSR